MDKDTHQYWNHQQTYTYKADLSEWCICVKLAEPPKVTCPEVSNDLGVACVDSVLLKDS